MRKDVPVSPNDYGLFSSIVVRFRDELANILKDLLIDLLNCFDTGAFNILQLLSI